MKLEDMKAIIEVMADWSYVGYIEGMLGVNTEGQSLDEVTESLVEGFLLLSKCKSWINTQIHIFDPNILMWKTREVAHYLLMQWCRVVMEDRNHVVFNKPRTGKFSTLPKCNELSYRLIRRVCTDLGIPWLV